MTISLFTSKMDYLSNVKRYLELSTLARFNSHESKPAPFLFHKEPERKRPLPSLLSSHSRHRFWLLRIRLAEHPLFASPETGKNQGLRDLWPRGIVEIGCIVRRNFLTGHRNACTRRNDYLRAATAFDLRRSSSLPEQKGHRVSWRKIRSDIFRQWWVLYLAIIHGLGVSIDYVKNFTI